jgi:hypothetical protein
MELDHVSLTRVLNQFGSLMEASDRDLKSIRVTYLLLEVKAAALRELDTQVLEMLDDTDAELDKAMAAAEEYQAKFVARKLGFDANQTADERSITSASKHNARKFKLPKLEFRKFGGEIKDLLG